VKQALIVAVLVTLTMFSTAHPHASLAAAGRVQVELSQAISMAPAYIVVRAIVERDAKNRAVELVADSGAFYRRSVIELDGAQAPKVSEMRLKDIPGGDYDISATLYDDQGARAVAHATLRIVAPNNDR
jgi:hypothetical protein